MQIGPTSKFSVISPFLNTLHVILLFISDHLTFLNTRHVILLFISVLWCFIIYNGRNSKENLNYSLDHCWHILRWTYCLFPFSSWCPTLLLHQYITLAFPKSELSLDSSFYPPPPLTIFNNHCHLHINNLPLLSPSYTLPSTTIVIFNNHHCRSFQKTHLLCCSNCCTHCHFFLRLTRMNTNVQPNDYFLSITLLSVSSYNHKVDLDKHFYNLLDFDVFFSGLQYDSFVISIWLIFLFPF